jgi:hypothetical protein
MPDKVTLPKLTPEQLIAAHRHLHARVDAVRRVVRNVTWKYPLHHLPAGFKPVAQDRPRTRTIFPSDRVSLWFEGGSNFEFPAELLAASDRVIASWARERIRACRRNSFNTERKKLQDDIELAEKRMQREAEAIALKRRQLENLGPAPEWPKHKKEAHGA